jgi:hypothetical protein
LLSILKLLICEIHKNKIVIQYSYLNKNIDCFGITDKSIVITLHKNLNRIQLLRSGREKCVISYLLDTWPFL